MATFPWSQFIHTTVGLGEGVSYAARTPFQEVRDRENPRFDTNRLLNFLAWDISVGTAKSKDWALVYRIHHRSSIWGIYGSGVMVGSNANALGIRYTYQPDCSTF
jgi:hypothetical protein